MEEHLQLPPSLIAPAPWSLTGKGLILLYHIPEHFNLNYGFLADYQLKNYKGGIGAVMLVNYNSSGVGPYQELIYLPGLFDFENNLAFSISKIFVSTYNSVWNGRENWGIPKEKADFSVMQNTDGILGFEVRNENSTFFKIEVKPRGPKLPFTTKLIPLNKIVQQLRHKLLFTNIQANGKTQFASIKSVYADENYFPPVHQLTPLLAVYVPNFIMAFPVAQILHKSA